MNVKDLPQGSYKVINPVSTGGFGGGKMNINNLPKDSYKMVDTTQEPKTPFLKSNEPTFKANEGGAGSVIPNIAKTFGNIPSSARNLFKATVAPVNPFDVENPMNIGANISKSVSALGDIWKNRGVIQGGQDIRSGNIEMLKKGFDLYKGAGEKIYSKLEKDVETMASIKKGVGKTIVDTTSDIAKVGIEDPLLIPSVLYGGEVVGKKDLISRVAKPITRGADTSVRNIIKTVPDVYEEVMTKAVQSKQPQAVDWLENKLSELSSGTTAGKKKLDKLGKVTENLNKAGTEGKTPMRILAEDGVIPQRKGTKLDTYEQASEYRSKVEPLKIANKEALKEIETFTVPSKLDDLEKNAIKYARTPENINSGRAKKMETEIKKEFDILREEYPNGEIPLSLEDEIKSARWDNVFKNKGLVDVDVLKKDSEYAIAKALQKDIERVAKESGNDYVAQLNRDIGDRLEASKFLEDLNGKTIKGGRLLKYVTTAMGSAMGETIFGKLLGALGGNVVGELIISNNVANPMKRFLLNRLKTENPQSYKNTIEWLQTQNLNRETRLLLEAPNNTQPLINQGRPIPVLPRGQKEYIGSETIVGGYQSKSPTKTQTTSAINNDNIIPPIIPEKTGIEKVIDKVKKDVKDYIKNPKLGLSIEDVSKDMGAYKGEKDLTTKILKDLEGKTTVSKQYILDATNRPELKQTERDLIRQALETEGNTVNVNDFAKKVKAELLPLKMNSSKNGELFYPKYENITLPDEIKGKVKNYEERIYESPIKTSAGQTHFGDVENYFGHTRIEDMADNKTRRVIEVQSDLYQKGNLEREAVPNERYAKDFIKDLPKNIQDEYAKLTKESASRANPLLKDIPERTARIKEIEQMAVNTRGQQVSKLQQYNDPTAHFRMIREEIKKAAEDGKTKLQFPTGETAMKIEGLGSAENRWRYVDENQFSNQLFKDKLKTGLQIDDGYGNNWIITDVLGDGKFKAVPKSVYDRALPSAFDQTPMVQDSLKETFDISGKVDTNNPIYKFYEKEVGKYLNKFGGKRVVDDKGVSWIEVPITKEQGKLPVEAFGIVGGVGLGSLLGVTNNKK